MNFLREYLSQPDPRPQLQTTITACQYCGRAAYVDTEGEPDDDDLTFAVCPWCDREVGE